MRLSPGQCWEKAPCASDPLAWFSSGPSVTVPAEARLLMPEALKPTR